MKNHVAIPIAALILSLSAQNALAQGCQSRWVALCVNGGGETQTPAQTPFQGYSGPSIAQQEAELRQLQRDRQNALEQMRLNDQRAEQQRQAEQLERMRQQFEREQAKATRQSSYR